MSKPHNRQYSDLEPSLQSKSPWQNESLLRTLYCEDKLSTREIADRLGCCHTTVCTWLHRHDIETRPANHEKTQPHYEITEKGYAYVKVHLSDGSHRVGMHQLAAIVEGADPHDVFSDETHCHHRAKSLKVDVPANIEVMIGQSHLSGHATGELDQPPLDQVLRLDDAPPEED